MGKLDLYTDKHLNQLRHLEDGLADKAVCSLLLEKELLSGINSWQEIPDSLPDIFPPAVKNYFEFFLKDHPHKEAPFIREAQFFFEKYSSMILSLLGFYSLPYTYAFGDGAEVLVRSRKIVENPGERLAETALFVLECYRPGAFESDKRVLMVLAKVRLIHAMSRHFIKKHAVDWDQSWGQPINQEDLLSTNLTFSLLISRGIQKSNHSISSKEREMLLAYWGLVGHYLGVDTKFWPASNKEAFELEKIIRKRHLKKSIAGKVLLHSLLNFYRKNLFRPELSPFLENILQYYLGEEISRILELNASQKLPEFFLKNLNKFSPFSQSAGNSTFHSIYKEFLTNTQKALGVEVGINLPMPRK
ncbi:oxygenase MpaB family protein [Cyclobacterium plantarum]|uniref:oxygenase MpaB family protein n=1 Tax=Cyclobacterium plantarum TaxID=2716263 RepID=UPI003F6FD28A